MNRPLRDNFPSKSHFPRYYEYTRARARARRFGHRVAFRFSLSGRRLVAIIQFTGPEGRRNGGIKYLA